MRSALTIVCCWALAFIEAVVAAKVGETQVGGVRVQCLSPVLIRVEPNKGQGKDGNFWFEDRNTFLVQNRHFQGEPIEKQDGNKIVTKHYTIEVTGTGPGKPNFMVFNTEGKTVYNAGADDNRAPHLLFWPAPGAKQAYAIVDKPRFTVPDWGCAPLWPGAPCDGGLIPTNGYDFNSQVDGDTYVFLLGSGVDDWNKARAEFASLSGPVPLLPDFAFGTWWTWWHWYTEASAKKEIEIWDSASLPIDVWGLDMEWRLATGNADHYYDKPNGSAFPDFGGWFGYLKLKKLRTYFNDHPYPAGPQLSKGEIDFRWNGLTGWMHQGLDFWWFDHNWKYCLPPPQTESLEANANWNGLTNAAWGSHVYYTIVKHYNEFGRDKMKDPAYMPRPIILSKYTQADWSNGMDPHMAAESPGQHRYPIWWTGDKVELQASVESMVDAGVYHFKPYVHSDCGGDEWVVKAGGFMRWIAHCVFGNILRIHGSDHRPWIYGGWWEDDIRKYLQMRYRLMPSIVAAGQRATKMGFPLAARLDLYWPELWQQSTSNHQYLFLDDLLVAPIMNGEVNMASRSLWIPPGEWQDVWTGDITKGPKQITAWQPWERQPMWHRRDGGMYILVDDPKLRIRDQDWSKLTIDTFICKNWCPEVKRKVYDLSDQNGGNTGETEVIMGTDGRGHYQWNISKASDGKERAWTVRINMRPGQKAINAEVDGKWAMIKRIVKIGWDDGSPLMAYFPFGGGGSPPAARAGNVAEIEVPKGGGVRVIKVMVGDGYMGRTFCAWNWNDCGDTKCCKLSSSQCFEKNPFFSICNATCDPNFIDKDNPNVIDKDGKPWSCKVLGAAPPPPLIKTAKKLKDALKTSLFCFTVVDGKDDQDLIDAQKEQKAGIFACDAHFVMKKPQGNASESFGKVWYQLKDDTDYEKYDWVVKVAPNVVFVPQRLQKHLEKLSPPSWPGEVYLKTSEDGVGITEDFKVFSKNALLKYWKHIWKCGQKVKKFTTEGFNMVVCMDAYDIGYMNDFEIVQKGLCGYRGAAFLGQKDSDSWLTCYKKATGKASTSDVAADTSDVAAKFSITSDETVTTVAATRMPWATTLATMGIACLVGAAAMATCRAKGRPWSSDRRPTLLEGSSD